MTSTTTVRPPIPDIDPAVEAGQLVEWLRRHGIPPVICDRLDQALDDIANQRAEADADRIEQLEEELFDSKVEVDRLEVKLERIQVVLDEGEPDRPSPCQDCGTDTTPPGEPHEWYSAKDEVWATAGMPAESTGAYLCVGCLEKRLGRPLTPGDFTDAPINGPGWAGRRSERLNARLDW